MMSPGRFLRLLNQPCEGMARLASEGQDRPLTAAERFAVGLHALYCSACRRFRRQLAFLRRAARRLADPAPPPGPAPSLPPAARARILRALGRADGAGEDFPPSGTRPGPD